MALKLHHSVLLQTPLEKVSAVLCDPKELPKMQILAGCQKCVLNSEGTDSPPAIDINHLIAKLDDKDVPSDVPWPALDSKAAAHFSFEEATGVTTAKVTGVQFSYSDAVVFHSTVKSFGLVQKKLRILEKVSDSETRVTETVWITAPAVLQWGLKMSGVAVKVHKKQMDAYGQIFA